ncbi:MAG: phosphoribosylaminoimidazolecarboxamide formyltransferase [Clostridia bacterium]|nr:phosphoribosylaminoimidazolecarboxamide formyltransferase [Clostridia bacterium]
MPSEIVLKYGCNPNQDIASIYMKDNKDLPVKVLNGRPGYINFLDAFNAWQLVKELNKATGLAAAASFKHTSPAGAAVYTPMSQRLKRACFADDLELSELATALAKARGADRMSSYGDFVALSDECDESCAMFLKREVSDGVIAPSYTEKALEILKSKRKGNYNIIQIDKDYIPDMIEEKELFGVTFKQKRNDVFINEDVLKNIKTKAKDLPKEAKRDLIVALITLKYTQSNSVCYAKDGQAIGVGAGQQSRIHCTRLAGNKADIWHLRQSDYVLNLKFKKGLKRPEIDNAIDVYLSEDFNSVIESGEWEKIYEEKPLVLTSEMKREYLKTCSEVSLASDAFFPFGDNIKRAYLSRVKYIAQTGGSIRDDDVIATADELGMVMAFTGIRLFYH